MIIFFEVFITDAIKFAKYMKNTISNFFFSYIQQKKGMKLFIKDLNLLVVVAVMVKHEVETILEQGIHPFRH